MFKITALPILVLLVIITPKVYAQIGMEIPPSSSPLPTATPASFVASPYPSISPVMGSPYPSASPVSSPASGILFPIISTFPLPSLVPQSITKIRNIAPQSGYQGDTFTLTGVGFSPIAGDNLILVNKSPLLVYGRAYFLGPIRGETTSVSADGTVLTFVLGTDPDYFDIGEAYYVQVSNKINGVSNAIPLTITSPVSLKDIQPDQAHVEQQITLRGSDFGKETGEVRFYAESMYGFGVYIYKFVASGIVTNWDNTKIKVRVPNLSSNQKYKIMVKVSRNQSNFSYVSNKIPFTIISNSQSPQK